MLLKETNFVWDPEWYRNLIFKMPNDVSSAIIATISVHQGLFKSNSTNNRSILLKYNTIFNDRLIENSLNSPFISSPEKSNVTTKLTQQDIQTSSCFGNEESVETKPTTTQQNFSPIHPTIITPHNKNNTSFPQTTLEPTLKPLVVRKHLQTDYQT